MARFRDDEVALVEGALMMVCLVLNIIIDQYLCTSESFTACLKVSFNKATQSLTNIFNETLYQLFSHGLDCNHHY